MTAADGNVMYKLEKGYQITRVLGKECLMILRDKYSTPLATIELCRGKISSVTISGLFKDLSAVIITV